MTLSKKILKATLAQHPANQLLLGLFFSRVQKAVLVEIGMSQERNKQLELKSL